MVLGSTGHPGFSQDGDGCTCSPKSCPLSHDHTEGDWTEGGGAAPSSLPSLPSGRLGGPRGSGGAPLAPQHPAAHVSRVKGDVETSAALWPNPDVLPQGAGPREGGSPTPGASPPPRERHCQPGSVTATPLGPRLPPEGLGLGEGPRLWPPPPRPLCLNPGTSCSAPAQDTPSFFFLSPLSDLGLGAASAGPF